MGIREISRAAYAEFLGSVSHSVFQRLEWLAIVEQIYSIRFMPLGYFHANKLQAVIPLLRRRFGVFVLWGATLRKCPIPPAVSFCAPPEKADLVLPAFEVWVRHQRIGFAQVTYSSFAEPSPPVGDAAEKSNNLELNVSRPLPELWQLLAKKTRYTVRRAVKDGVKLHWASNVGFLATQSRLLRDTYVRQGINSNYPLELYRILLEKRRELHLRVLYASVAGRVIATAWLLTDEHRCYYWDAATGTEGRELNANQVLVWSLIRWAHRRGFDILDFVGTSIGGRGGSRPGIGHFKRSMGAEPVEYLIIYWYSPVYRFALRIYRSWSHFKRQLVQTRESSDGGER